MALCQLASHCVSEQSDKFYSLHFCASCSKNGPKKVLKKSKVKFIRLLWNWNVLKNMICKNCKNLKINRKFQLEVGAFPFKVIWPKPTLVAYVVKLLVPKEDIKSYFVKFWKCVYKIYSLLSHMVDIKAQFLAIFNLL